MQSLIALGISMLMVVVAATAVIWVKDPTTIAIANRTEHLRPHHSPGGTFYTSITATCIGVLLACLTGFSMAQMYYRLHTRTPESSTLHLRSGSGRPVADASEFYVASDPQQPSR